jgi:RHS repeat-associated protein
VSANGDSFGYDTNGNMTSKTDASGTWAYSWSYENQLKQAALSGGVSVTYSYDGLGRRILRTSSTGGTTKFIYDGAEVVRDLDGSGTTLVDYLNGPGIDNKLRLITPTSVSYILSDHVASTRGLADVSGTLLSTVSYDSFGELSAGSTSTRYRFTGREADEETGSYYYRARFYDPKLARFLGEDPLGVRVGPNMYEYVFQNPLRFVDPSGLQWQQAVAGGGVLTTAAAAVGGGAVLTGAGAVAGYGLLLYGAWQLGEAIAEAPWNPFTHPKDLPQPRVIPKCEPKTHSSRDDRCEKQYEIDVSTCNGVSRVRGKAAGARCFATATERYAACLAGRPIPPLDTWNN